MTSLKIESIKEFMTQLFSETAFDKFLVSDAEVRTMITTKINGALQSEWFSDEEREELGLKDYAKWKQVRPIVFDLVKGRRTPNLLMINFMLAMKNGDSGILRIHYQMGECNLITAYNMAEFTLEKGKEIEWDEWCREFLKKIRIPFSESE